MTRADEAMAAARLSAVRSGEGAVGVETRPHTSWAAAAVAAVVVAGSMTFAVSAISGTDPTPDRVAVQAPGR